MWFFLLPRLFPLSHFPEQLGFVVRCKPETPGEQGDHRQDSKQSQKVAEDAKSIRSHGQQKNENGQNLNNDRDRKAPDKAIGWR